MGTFRHEDVQFFDGRYYLTEDIAKRGHVFRYTPGSSIQDGRLEVLIVDEGWRAVDPEDAMHAARDVGGTEFKAPEGMASHDGSLYLAESKNDVVHRILPSEASYTTVLDSGVRHPDYLGTSPGGDLFICEDLYKQRNRVLPWDGETIEVVADTSGQPSGIEFGDDKFFLNLIVSGKTFAVAY